MDFVAEYTRWCKDEHTEENLRKELLALTDEKEIEDRFYRKLEFGTAGLRGVLGAGTNRMNIHTVRQATHGLAAYINTIEGAAAEGVVIAYDSRNMSDVFAKAAALVLAECGVRVYLFKELHPVPMLSFAIRNIGCTAGIVITASHNPPEYNGYKVYWRDGGQITPDRCSDITKLIENCDPLNVKYMDEQEAVNSGLLSYIGDEVDRAYYDYTKSLSVHSELTAADKSEIRVVYTPLHGSGRVPVTTLLSELGYESLFVVEEQKLPDGDFPTVKAPNPENEEAFSIAKALAKEKDADIILATDPDSDRLGVCIKDADAYRLLTGNQIGAMLVHYILSAMSEKNEIPHDACVVQSIVSTRLTEKICESYGVKLYKVLTGFRYIAEHIEWCERERLGTFIFGFEESYGFLAGTSVRDKDGVLAAMLVTEAAAYYKTQGKSISCVLREMDDMYGAYTERGKSFTVSGKDGMEKLASAMKQMHTFPEKEFAGLKVTAFTDYKKGVRSDFLTGEASKTDLPEADVLCYELSDAAWICMRPSGTEPKLKVYVGANADSRDQAEALLDKISESVINRVGQMLQ